MGEIDVEIPIATALGKRGRKVGADEKDIQVIVKHEDKLNLPIQVSTVDTASFSIRMNRHDQIEGFQ